MKPVHRVRRWPDANLFASLVAFRAVNALLVRTYFSPDEYWQALEVAHKTVFGYGYLTWEWHVALRSILHPALFAALYRVLSALGLDDGRLFIYAPRLLQSVFAAAADLYTYRFAYRLYENQAIANWTDTGELDGGRLDYHRTLLLAIRHGSILNDNHRRYLKKGDMPSFIATILNTAIIGGAAIVGSALLDSTLFYSEWVWTPLNFIRVNILEGIALFYVVYSSLQHKEWRFLYPMLYPLLPYAGDSMYRIWLLSRTARNRSSNRSNSSSTGSIPKRRLSSRTAMGLMVVLVVVNAVMAWYTVWIHQRGVVDVMEWIRNQARQADQIRSVGVLMPCHSTPWYSNVHLRHKAPLEMWFVTCSPPLGHTDPASYKDESDIFYEDPVAFLSGRIKEQMQDRGSKDSHLVFFEDLLRSHSEMIPWLEMQGYQEV
ncbi:hypothetical protein EC968_001417 [Mortierella alpina]|nr:hypothetical protein EC968_001417 [Mortierella alpina]